jgi:hypothetical protein
MSFLTTLAIVSIQAICIGYSCILGAKLADKLYAIKHTYPVIAICLGFPLIILIMAIAISNGWKGDLILTIELSSIFFVGGISARFENLYFFKKSHR